MEDIFVEYYMNYEQYFENFDCKLFGVESFDESLRSELKYLYYFLHKLSQNDIYLNRVCLNEINRMYKKCEKYLQSQYLAKTDHEKKITYLDVYKNCRKKLKESSMKIGKFLELIDDGVLIEDVAPRVYSKQSEKIEQYLILKQRFEHLQQIRDFIACKTIPLNDANYNIFNVLLNNMHESDKWYFRWMINDELIKRHVYFLNELCTRIHEIEELIKNEKKFISHHDNILTQKEKFEKAKVDFGSS